MANIFIPAKTEKRPNIFAPARGTSSKANIFAPAGPKPSGPTEESAAALEQTAAAAGAREFAPGPLGFLQRILAHPASQTVVDLISRGNYAAAGALEAAAAPAGEGIKGTEPAARLAAAGSRAGREILSGLPGITGEKRAFGEVLERLGVPAGPTASIVVGAGVPGLYTETGEGAPLQIGGPLDPTARGALGLVLDIAADPLNLLSAGTGKGLQIATEQGAKTFTRAGGRAVAAEVARLGLPEAIKAGEVTADVIPRAGTAIMERVARRAAGKTVEARLVPQTGALEARKAAQTAFQAATEESSVALGDLIDRETSVLVGAGFKKGDPLYREFTRAVVDEAKQRVLTAARTAPGLLDKGGIKFAGLTLPGTPKLATKASQVSAKTVEALGRIPAVGAYVMKTNERVGAAYDAIGRVFNRDWTTRNLPYYLALKQAHLDATVALEAKVLDGIDKSEAYGWLRKQSRSVREEANKAIVKAAEAGDLSALSPQQRVVAQDLRQTMDDMGLREHGVGLLAQTRANYVAHYYDNTDKELRQIFGGLQGFEVWNGKKIDMATLGRHNEVRAFDTLAEAEGFANAVKAAHPKAPLLRPVWDPVEITARRAHAHANAVGFQSWYETVAKEFGQDIPYDAETVFEMTRAPMGKASLSSAEQAEYSRIGHILASDKSPPVAFVRALSGAGREEALRQMLGRAVTRDEVASIFGRYREFQSDFPRLRQTANSFFDAEGKPFAQVNAGKLVGIPLPQEIAQDIAETGGKILDGKELGALLKGWDYLSNWFKTWVTVAFPAFHVRNAYTNVANAFLDVGFSALDPVLHKDSALILAGKDGEFVTKHGARYSYQELRDLARETNVATTGAGFAELTGKRPAFEKGIGAAARSVGSTIENEARMQLFLNHVRRGSDPLIAAQRVKEVLFDYQNLSTTEKEVFRRAIPFYAWQRKNLALQVRMLATHPGLSAAEIKPFRGRQSEDREMTSWEAGAFKLRLDRDGRTVHVITGIDLPIRSLDVLWRGSLQGTMSSNLGMLSPYLKSAIEIAAGKSLFTGKEFSRQESSGVGRFVEKAAPPAVKQWLGYKAEKDEAGRTKYTFDGERFYILFQSWAVSRIVSTTDRQFRSLVQSPDSWTVLLDVMTGLRDKKLDLDEEQAKRLAERQRYLQRLLERQGELKKGTYYYKAKP